MRIIAMIAIILSAFFVTSRLQVNEGAQFVVKGGEVIEGRVKRDFMSGDYVIETLDGKTRRVAYGDFGAMSFVGSAIPFYAAVLGFLLIILGAVVGFGAERRLFALITRRKQLAIDGPAARKTQQGHKMDIWAWSFGCSVAALAAGYFWPGLSSTTVHFIALVPMLAGLHGAWHFAARNWRSAVLPLVVGLAGAALLILR